MSETEYTKVLKQINNKLTNSEEFQVKALKEFKQISKRLESLEIFQTKTEAFQTKTEAFQTKTEAFQVKTETFQVETTRELSALGLTMEEMKGNIQTISEAVATLLRKSEEDTKLKNQVESIEEKSDTTYSTLKNHVANKTVHISKH